MEPHQQRVVDEKAELDDRMTKLRAFVASSPVYLGLPVEEQLRLARQYAYMSQYSDVLGERIEAFGS